MHTFHIQTGSPSSELRVEISWFCLRNQRFGNVNVHWSMHSFNTPRGAEAVYSWLTLSLRIDQRTLSTLEWRSTRRNARDQIQGALSYRALCNIGCSLSRKVGILTLESRALIIEQTCCVPFSSIIYIVLEHFLRRRYTHIYSTDSSVTIRTMIQL